MKTLLLIAITSILLSFSTKSLKAQWSANSMENTTVCDLDNRQTLPKVGATSDGGCFISWFDSRGNGQYKVYLQRLNGQGVKQFAADGLLISDKPQNSYLGDYDLEVDGSDNAIIVFPDRRNSGADTILNPFAYKISSTGEFLWGPDGVTISTNANAYQVWPKAAVLSDGSVAIVWWYINTAERNSWITMQRLNSAGVPQFTNPINIQDPGGKRYQYPDVCAADNGNFILSWVYGPKDTVGSFVPDNVSIFTGKYNSSGSALWGSSTIVYTNTGNHVPIYSVPRVYSDNNGGALYSYFTDETSVLYSSAQRYNSSGTALFPANGSEGSTNASYDHVEPCLTYMSSTNETYIFWTEADAGTQSHQAVFGQRFSSAGARMWGNNGIGFSPLDEVAVFGISCFARDTNVVVFYGTDPFASVNTTLKSFRVGKSGVSNWAGGTINVSNAVSAKGYIVGSMAGNTGVTIAAWEDSRNSSGPKDGGIYAQNINYNGTIGPVGITQISTIVPDNYSLNQNYPNPFNSSTVIEFRIKENGNYKFEIFDMLGKKIDEVLNEYKTAGSYKVYYNPQNISSGVYLYKLSSDKINLTKKFILVK
ncbi:MAG: T9SS type A sorting domain-containing protein [Ignavibacteria bacterium]